MYALVDNASGNVDIVCAGENFAAPSGKTWVAVPDGVGATSTGVRGWTYTGGAFVAPTPAALTPAQLNAYANSKVIALLGAGRLYEGAAVAGVTLPAGVTGITCAAAPGWLSLLTINAWGLANPTATQEWTDDLYEVFTLTGAQAVVFSDVALGFGKAVYATLATAATGIKAGALTTTAAIDALAWPT